MYLQDWCTPLFVASARGFNDVVKSLIAANADVNCVCKVSCYIMVNGINIMYSYIIINTCCLKNICSHKLALL